MTKKRIRTWRRDDGQQRSADDGADDRADREEEGDWRVDVAEHT